MSDPLRVGGLYSGIGGLELGLERAGMHVEWMVEIDDFCNTVLAKHWPAVPRYRDVRDVRGRDVVPVDVLCGGFPCQDVSLAGRRLGLAGQRSTLWSEFARLVREIRPRWVVVENVPGLLSSDAGRFFGNILRDLAACGYDAEWRVLSAAAVGAPHLRERVFVVAYPAIEQGHDVSVGAGPYVFAETGVQVEPGRGGHAAANTNGEGLEKRQGVTAHAGTQQQAVIRSDWWASEPDVGRVAYGVPARVDRLRSLGNAVVPQDAEYVGRCIVAADAALRDKQSRGVREA